MKRTGSLRRKTRSKLKKNYRRKGKVNISKYLQEFNIGDKVYLDAEPSVQKGMYHPRFHGKSGTIIGKTGSCYEVKFKENKSYKIFIVHPVHLKGA